MNIVVCKCTRCGARLGAVANLWLQIGKKYMTPMTPMTLADDGEQPWAIATAGALRCGDAGSLVVGCQLQDAECASCQAGLGQKCLSCPANHVLNDGQVIFRKTSISLASTYNLRRAAEPNIQRVLKLKMVPASHGEQAAPLDLGGPAEDEGDAPGHSSGFSSLDFMQIQAQLDVQRESIARIGASGVQVVSNFEAAMSRVDGHVQRLSESIGSVRADGEGQRVALDALKAEVTDAKWGRHNDDAVVARLQQQLKATDRVVTELRHAIHQSKSETESLREQLALTQQELQGVRDETAALGTKVETAQAAQESAAASREYACEMSLLRREVKQLRAQLTEERAQSQAVGPPSISAHELDILTSSIAKIGNRASQVDSLQMELDLFRSRLQRIEARTNAPGAYLSRGNGAMAIQASAGSEGGTQAGYGAVNARKKRTSTCRDDRHGPETTTPPKRAAMSPSDLDSGVSIGGSRASDVCRYPPVSGKTSPRPSFRRLRASTGEHGTTRRETWADDDGGGQPWRGKHCVEREGDER